VSDQEREERSDESPEDEEMSADSGAAEEGGDTETEEEPLSEYKPKPLSGY
jgi:hypothetical protein